MSLYIRHLRILVDWYDLGVIDVVQDVTDAAPVDFSSVSGANEAGPGKGGYDRLQKNIQQGGYEKFVACSQD